jgi:hypothetical protein
MPHWIDGVQTRRFVYIDFCHKRAPCEGKKKKKKRQITKKEQIIAPFTQDLCIHFHTGIYISFYNNSGAEKNKETI